MEEPHLNKQEELQKQMDRQFSDDTNRELEEIRRKIEKILWREYNPDYAPNFEEVSQEIVNLLLSKS